MELCTVFQSKCKFKKATNIKTLEITVLEPFESIERSWRVNPKSQQKIYCNLLIRQFFVNF